MVKLSNNLIYILISTMIPAAVAFSTGSRRVVFSTPMIHRTVSKSLNLCPGHISLRGVTCLFSTDTDSAAEKTDEEKEAIKAAREARKAEKERMKAEKKALKAKKAAERAALEALENAPIEPVTYLSVDDEPKEIVGDFTTIMSRSQTGRNFVQVKDLPDMEPGQKVWLRGRLHSIRIKGGSCFLVVRQDSFDTVQALFFKNKDDPDGSKKMIKYLKTLTVESIIDIEGTLAEAEVKSCSVQNLEVNINRIHSVAKAAAMLPFLVEDAARSEKDIDESQDTERPFPRLGQVSVPTGAHA